MGNKLNSNFNKNKLIKINEQSELYFFRHERTKKDFAVKFIDLKDSDQKDILKFE